MKGVKVILNSTSHGALDTKVSFDTIVRLCHSPVLRLNCKGQCTMPELIREWLGPPWTVRSGGDDRRAALKHKLMLSIISAMLGALA
jgi:hypothetical protein